MRKAIAQEMICPQCQAAFSCCAASDAPCWCSHFPPVMPVDDRAVCYCACCLEKAISQQVHVLLFSKQADAALMRQVSKLGVPQLPAEGTDYYINAEGNWVFTAWYHLKRGQCCRNGCLHCPYGFRKQQT